MELRTLRYFLAVAYEGNITHAAQSLYISQPSLTRQIQLLEEELGCKLFVRKRHSVELTSEGLELRSRAIEALQIIEHIEHDFASRSDQEISGSVFIAAAETEGMRTIARVASRLRTKHPGIVIELTTGDAFSVADRLDKGLADVAVFCEPANVAKYHSRRLPEMDTWGVLMRADDPLAQKEAIVSSDFAHRPCYISAQQRSTEHETNPFRVWMGRKRGQFKTAGTLDLVRNAATMIAASGELSLTFESIGGYKSDELVFRPLSPTLQTGSFAAWKRGRTFSDAARLFVDTLKEELAGTAEPADQETRENKSFR